MQEIKKIVVIGPESTGKSTLCSLLAKHFNTTWCQEYAREYLLQHGTDYTFETLEEIAKGQLVLEDKAISVMNNQLSATSHEYFAVEAPEKRTQQSTSHSSLSTHNSQIANHNPLLFIDTDMYVMKVWCEYVFGKCHQFILDEIASRKYDLYLLCNTDLPWVKDELREYPDEKFRIELFHIYKDLLVNQTTPWVEIKGEPNKRLETAIKAVNHYCL